MYAPYKYALFLCLIFIGSGKLYAQENILDKKITLLIHQKETVLILQKIEEITGARFSYDERKIPLLRKTTVATREKPLAEVLRLLFLDTNVEFRAIGNNISLYRDKLPKYTISGYLREANSSEALIGGAVYETENFRGTAANAYGFYSLTLAEGTYYVNWDFLGYAKRIDTIYLTSNRRINVYLQAKNLLQEIIVLPKDSSELGTVSPQEPSVINNTNLAQYPAIMGEHDPLRVVALFPGVQSGSEGSNGLSVRGGGPDQNLVLLDGVPVYNVYHLFGFLSIFNGHAVNSAEVIKDGFPARYGGRLSSVLDVRMKEGNSQEFHGGISMGLISGSVDFEGPLIKDRTSFFVSGRRTWLDLLARGSARIAGSDIRGGYGFYDTNIKINHKFSEKSRLFISTFLGEDRSLQREILQSGKVKRVNETAQFWGNKTASLRYNQLISPKLFSNTSLTYSNYGYGLRNYANSDQNEKDPTKVNVFDLKSISRIDDIGAKHDFDYLPNARHYIRFGAGYVFHNNHPSNNKRLVNMQGEETRVAIRAPSVNSHEFYAYFEDDFLIHKKIKLNPGIHLAGMSVKSGDSQRFHTYILPQFRLSGIYQINRQQSVKAAYSGMGQFTHLLTDPGIGFPKDLWVPSTDRVRPSLGHQFSLGYDLVLDKGYSFSAGSFYKLMYNLLEYKNGASFLSSSTDWENQVTTGQGWAYGGELLLRKQKGKTIGWLSYTLSWSFRNFEELNAGKTFPFRFDRRHSINTVIQHKFGPRIDVGVVWSYGTGNAATLSLERYLSLDAVWPFPDLEGEEIFDLSVRNNYRMPAYHRLDVNINFHKLTKRGKQSWTVGLVNVYNRKNPFTVYPRRTEDNQVEVVQFSMLPIPLPYATYNFRF